MEKHAQRCSIVRAQSQNVVPANLDVTQMLQSVLNRVTAIEQSVTAMGARIDALENPRATRGPYQMRKSIPTHGFGIWSPDWFLSHVKPSCEWFHKKSGFPLVTGGRDPNIIRFICTVLYCANNESKLVEFGKYEKDRAGYPLYIDVNTQNRLRRHVSLDGAIKTVFENVFLPSWPQLLATLSGVRGFKTCVWKNWGYYETRFRTKVDKGLGRKSDSFKCKWELIDALAQYEEPEIDQELLAWMQRASKAKQK